MIPSQLQKQVYRFIKVKKNSKQPLEKDWVKTNNYQHNNPQLQKHIKQGGNYGVLGGYGNLVIIDCDTPELTEKVQQHLPKTLTIQTGSGGKHYYYHIPDLNKPIRLQDHNHTNLGDIQGYGKQVVGPNSIHPNGNTYQILENHPITTIKKENIKLTFKDYIKNGTQHILTQSTRYQDTENLNILDIANTTQLTKHGTEYYGPHPTHGSTGGQNFWINPQKNVWHCFRHDHGGGPLELLAIQEGIIECGDKLRGDAFKKTLEIANKKHGLTITTKYQKTVLPKELENKKRDILTKLVTKHRQEATEEIVKLIENKEHIYTIRDDEKSEVWIYDKGIYKPNGKTYIKETIRNILDEAYTTHIANEILNKIEADTYTEPKEFFDNNNPSEIIVENGILNLNTRELTPFTPNKIYFNKLPVKYNPNAKSPNIDKFFNTTLKHPNQDTQLIHEIFGFTLKTEYFIEKAILLVGTGRNGKSKTLDLIKHLLGPENCAATPMRLLENNDFARSTLLKKMVNLPGELSNKTLQDTSTFKDLTGRSYITADRKFKNPVEFVNYSKLIFAANEIPRTTDVSDAFFMRWIIIEYPNQFITKEELERLDPQEKQNKKIADPNIIKKIATPGELSGLLNHALDGLDRLEKNKDFSYNKSMAEIKKMWMRKSNSFKAFLMDCIEEEYESTISKKELQQAYHKYCRKHKLKSVGTRTIKNTLAYEHGVLEERLTDETRTRVWSGIKFKENYYSSYMNNKENGQGGQDGQGFQSSYREKSLYIGSNMVSIASILSKMLKLLQDMEEEFDEVDFDVFRDRCLDVGISPLDFNNCLFSLERDGVVYRPTKDVIRRNVK